MPHAVEMPSFASDDAGPTLLPSRPPFDLPSHLRHSHDNLNGNGNNRTLSYPSMKATVGDAPDLSLDGGSSGRSQVNGEIYNVASLHQLPNGQSGGSSWDLKSSHDDSTLAMNGGAANVAIENGNGSSVPQNGLPKPSNVEGTSVASANASLQNTPFEKPSKPAMSGDSEPPKRAPPPIPTNPQGTDPLILSSSPMSLPAETQLRPVDSIALEKTYPHRFSSPPAYPPPPPPSMLTGTLQNPVPNQIKHRHTLQVPKPLPVRSSRDGDEAFYSSGRFSPTTMPASVRRGSLSLNRRNTQSIHSNVPHEEIPLDEDAMRWAEAVRQKRASKRKRKDEEDEDRVVVGTKVDQNHVNWVTAYNMLTGIRFTVSRTNAKMDRPLTDADFDARHKFSFDITGNELTPSAKYDFKFKDYAPWVFRHLRMKFKLDPGDYLMSLTSKYILSELGSPGKSGSFFYFSRDYKYIIKTIHHAEHKFLRKILREYYSHVEENPNTLLSQFYGLHRVKIPYGRKIHFVVMNNLFPPHRDIHHTFDLKGSTIGRDFKEELLEENPRATLKDLNWLRRNMHLEFGPEKKRLFIEQMEKDVRLLQKLKIMDYSMLVGIHDLQKGNQENLRDKTLQVFQPGGDNHADDIDRPDGRALLMRTPSKLENARMARELRQMIKQEKPIPMGQSSSRMPDQMDESAIKKEFTFYSNDGGFRATHEDNSPGDEIFFLSIIDCLTHYGMVKKLEHLWKGLSHDKKLISPVAPDPYGDRFIRFIESITKSPEEVAAEAVSSTQHPSIPHTNSISVSDRMNSVDFTRRHSGNASMMYRTSTNNAIQRNESELVSNEQRGELEVEPRVPSTARSPSADRSGGLQGQTLPVVEEFGEASSTGGRSGRSGRSRERDDAEDVERRPVTPAKDYFDERPLTPAKDYSPNGSLKINARQLKRPISRQSLDKELPPTPPVTSPAETNEKLSVVV